MGPDPADEPLRFLASFAYFRTRDMAEMRQTLGTGRPAEIFADSGAHSARTRGIDLSLDDYAAWCRRWDRELVLYANLDVIRAPAATYRNQQDLQERGLAPLPVFHTGEPWHWLQRYLDDGHTYIALGALLKNPNQILLPWLAKAFAMAAGRAVFHGFGLTVAAAIREFPFYSIDSSSWSQAARYGVIQLFDPAKGAMMTIRLRDPKALLRYRNLLRYHRVDPMRLATRTSYDRHLLSGICVASYQHMQAWARKVHGPVTVPDGPRNPLTRHGAAAPAGLRLYLAGTGAEHFTGALEGYRRLQAAA
jgi:hypothetical protein